jgi:hypothetical protein
VTVEPEDSAAIERRARYLLHPPLSVERMRFDQEAPQVHYRRKRPSPLGTLTETLDPVEFLLRHLAAARQRSGAWTSRQRAACSWPAHRLIPCCPTRRISAGLTPSSLEMPP